MRAASIVIAALTLAACHAPPTLDAAGPFARSISLLSLALIALVLVILAGVCLALWAALFGSPKWKKRLGGERIVWICGLAIPTVVLTVILIWGLIVTRHISAEPPAGEMRVAVTGERWWWRVAYLDDAGAPILSDANEIHIPVGRPVTFELYSADVIHSFWIPRLGGKMDMIPGRRTRLRLQADAPGVYAGQCAEFCGGPHALMGLAIVAHAPEDFARWRAIRQAPRAIADSPGRRVFETAGCAACHRVGGTSANGLAGPDLSHVGSRRTLGAGILGNDPARLRAWIRDSHAFKPGNRMPPYKVLSVAELDAVTAYLADLK